MMSKKSHKKWFTPRLAIACAAILSAFNAMAADETQTLENITVTGTAVPTRVSHSYLDKHDTTDLKQAMKTQIGMGVGGGNGVAQYYSIRSVGEDKINLEVDGTSQSTKIFHHQSRFQLDPALVKSINVEKGTGAASSGLGALAGTIRVTTIDAKDLLSENQPFGFRIGAGWSSNKGNHENFAVYANTYGFDGLLMANFLNNKDYKDGSGMVNTGSRLKQRSYLAKIGYTFNNNHNIKFSYRQEDQKGNRTDKAEFMTLSLADGFLGFDNTEQKEETLNLEYTGRNIGFIDKLDANIFQIKTHDYKPPKGANNLTNVRQTLEESTIKSIGGNINFTSRFGNNHVLKYGVNLRRETSQPSYKGDGKFPNAVKQLIASPESKNEYGIYAEGIWNFDPVTLTTGLRYDYFKLNSASDNINTRSASHGQINPSLGVIWDLNPNFSLLANLNQASRSPRLNETLLANERAGALVDVDQNLKAETARRAEVGFKWDWNGLNVAGSIFYQDIKDLIVYKWSNIGKNERGGIYNSGHLKTRGFELDARYHYGGLTARIGVSQVNPRLSHGTRPIYNGEQEVLDSRQESSFYFWNTGRQWLTGLSYRFENPKLEVGWLGRYAQHTAYAEVIRGKKGVYRGQKAGYGVHDIYVNWQPLNNDTWNINFAVNNVGNKRYRGHSQRFPDGNGRIPFYERGREFTLSTNYRF